MRSFVYTAILFCLILGLYHQVWFHAFVNFDDNVYVFENQHVLSGLSYDHILWAFTHVEGGHWHPLTWLSLMLDATWSGLWAPGYAIINVVLYACMSCFMFQVLRKYTPYALLLACLIALHPLRVESVAWISERKDVLSGLFVWCSLWLYLVQKRYVASLVVFVLALMAKSTALVLPILLFFFESFDDVTISFSWLFTRLKELRWFFALSFLFSCLLYVAQDQTGALQHDVRTWLQKMLGVFASQGEALQHMFWPVDLYVFYPMQYHSVSWFHVCFFMACMLVLGVASFLLRSWRMVCGSIAMFACLLPYSGLIQAGGQRTADRFTWYALVIAVLMFHELWPRKKHLQFIVYACLCCILSVLSFYQIQTWTNSKTLWEHALAINNNNFMAHTNLGSYLRDQHRYQESAHHFYQAYLQNSTWPEALNNYGIVLAEQGMYSQAENLFIKALERRPHFQSAAQNLQQVRFDQSRR